ncbi:leucyl aminopeptidase family protein [Puteibacter caeruleilacunae]|nr:leucyl aminopeptidase family protein [Puteibacter caeruleilacunae]
MNFAINITKEAIEQENIAFLIENKEDLQKLPLSGAELDYCSEKFDNKESELLINRLTHMVFIIKVDAEKLAYQQDEICRKFGGKVINNLKKEKKSRLLVDGVVGKSEWQTAFIEGVVLGGYDFLKYKTEDTQEEQKIEILLSNSSLSEEDLKVITARLKAVYYTRDLVNEPVASLNATDLSTRIYELGKEAGFSVDILNKQKIESLKMGGLLAVNKGSIDPPTFTIMEWKPEGATNDKPVVLVGKGVVFDTGGVNLKTMPGSIDHMKADMGGAATVIGAVYAVAKAKMPVHVIGLIPATDNRPGRNAYVPGDVIKMHSGLTVEVLNTDAEGRMILADALSYAKKYDPLLTIDVATLTGAAAYSIGSLASVVMGNAETSYFDQLRESGYNEYERVVEFPFWDEYGEMIKSQVADIKNLGGREGGAITAGKFLEKFVDYPWIHMDIAGPAFIEKNDSYRGRGATGYGVRLLFNFLNKIK